MAPPWSGRLCRRARWLVSLSTWSHELPSPQVPLRALGAAAEGGRRPGRRLSGPVGDPCDPPSPAVVEALASAARASANRYPSSAGSPVAREAAARWMNERFGTVVGPEAVGLCVGTKELVAGLPGWLHPRQPEKDTVLYPELAYPTYEMGALLAGLRPVAVPVDEHFRLRLEAVEA